MHIWAIMELICTKYSYRFVITYLMHIVRNGGSNLDDHNPLIKYMF